MEKKMDKTMKSKFELSLSIAKMRSQAKQIGRDMGLTDQQELDAFTHTYVSAKASEMLGAPAANALGHGGEIFREVKERAYDVSSLEWGEGNPEDEWNMDIHNNKVGRDIEAEISKSTLTGDAKERKLRQEVFQAIKNEKTINDKNDPRVQENYKTPQAQEGKTKEGLSPNDKGSFLDGIGGTLGSIGSTVATGAQMAFNTAMSIGTDTLVHAVTGAVMNGGVGGGKAALESAAKVVLTQTLNNMHGLVMQEVEKQKGDVFRTPGIAGPIPDTDEKVKVSIERTVNDPKNSHIFHDIAAQIESVLQRADGVDPTVLIVSKVLETLKSGEIKMQPHILVPDMFAEEKDGSMRQSTGDKDRTLEVAGVHIPIRLPDVRVMDEGGAVGSDLHRGADGAIEVKSYTRSDGTKVDSYTRSAPDGIASNNFSFKGS